MSIYSMATSAARIRLTKDAGSSRNAPGGLVPAGAGGGGAQPATANAGQGAVDRALANVVEHIPTEIIGGYIAVLAVASSPSATSAGLVIFWFFLVLTPLAVWGAWATKLKASGDAVPFAPARWPWWPLLAAPFAFVAWAIALPGPLATTLFPQFQPYMATLALIGMAIVLALGDTIRDVFPTS